jgi:YesN/AraC family two-component response regulator
MMTAFASVELAVEAMKLGATDFLRKPMTPEVVRNSVAAALKQKSESQTEVESQAGPRIHEASRTVTMNGFTILRESDATRALPHQPNKRRFLARKPNGRRKWSSRFLSRPSRKPHELSVAAPLENAFWTSQAETSLSDFIWNDGDVPTGSNLILKAIDPDILAELAQTKERK